MLLPRGRLGWGPQLPLPPPEQFPCLGKPGGEDLWAPPALGRRPACREGKLFSQSQAQSPLPPLVPLQAPPQFPSRQLEAGAGPGQAVPLVVPWRAWEARPSHLPSSPQVYSADGEFLFKFGSHGEGNGQFNAPTGVAVDSNGNIIVADWGNSRIQVLVGSWAAHSLPHPQPAWGPMTPEVAPGPGRKSGLSPLIEAEAALVSFGALHGLPSRWF